MVSKIQFSLSPVFNSKRFIMLAGTVVLNESLNLFAFVKEVVCPPGMMWNSNMKLLIYCPPILMPISLPMGLFNHGASSYGDLFLMERLNSGTNVKPLQELGPNYLSC